MKITAKAIRRGTMAIAALAMVGALAACSTAAQQPASSAQAPVSSGGQAPTTVLAAGANAASRPAASSGGAVLGPDGYGGLKLGMSRSAAVATGMLSPAKLVTSDPNQCTGYDIVGHASGADSVGVWVSPAHGVAVIAGIAGWHTPEHIGLGASKAQVMAAYPNLVVGIDGMHTPVPGNDHAMYDFNLDQAGKVSQFALGLADQDCAN